MSTGQERCGSDLQQHSEEADWNPVTHCGVHLHEARDTFHACSRVSWLYALLTKQYGYTM